MMQLGERIEDSERRAAVGGARMFDVARRRSGERSGRCSKLFSAHPTASCGDGGVDEQSRPWVVLRIDESESTAQEWGDERVCVGECVMLFCVWESDVERRPLRKLCRWVCAQPLANVCCLYFEQCTT